MKHAKGICYAEKRFKCQQKTGYIRCRRFLARGESEEGHSERSSGDTFCSL